MRVVALLAIALAALPACARVHAAWRVLTQPEPAASAPGPPAPASPASPAPAPSPVPPAARGASAPAAAEPAPAGAPAVSAPSPPLTPDVPTDQARRLRDATQQRLDETDRLLRQLAGRPLTPKDRETVALAENLLDQARQALAKEEYERAANLTAKARTLADGLGAGTR